jgi:hypothetical protein
MVAPAIGTLKALATNLGIEEYEMARMWICRRVAGEAVAYRLLRELGANKGVCWRCMGLITSGPLRDVPKPYDTVFRAGKAEEMRRLRDEYMMESAKSVQKIC